MNFEQVRDRLMHEGRIFDDESLRDLAYKDLARAWIGDAGPAACTQDAARAEAQRRVEDQAWKILHQRMHPAGPTAMADPELYSAAMNFIQRRPVPPAAWADLSTISQTYLVLRCLRAHLDSPQDRLAMLSRLLESVFYDSSQTQAMRLCVHCTYGWILSHGAELTGGQPDDLLRFREATFHTFKYIRSQIPEKDATVCSHLEVTGYHCSNGCFLPGAAE